jgi:hypothetical protein
VSRKPGLVYLFTIIVFSVGVVVGIFYSGRYLHTEKNENSNVKPITTDWAEVIFVKHYCGNIIVKPIEPSVTVDGKEWQPQKLVSLPVANGGLYIVHNQGDVLRYRYVNGILEVQKLRKNEDEMLP